MPNLYSAILQVDIEYGFISQENAFPLIYSSISRCLAPLQLNSTVGFCNQRLLGCSTTMKTKQMFFLADGIYRNHSPGGLLELFGYVGHRFSASFSNFFGQHCSVSISGHLGLVVSWVLSVKVHFDNHHSSSTL
ncbi:hypothetical protein TNCV_375191 [Trichonephila clavipes]|nr:hypothetical protein TNCV_375191 [Trichonephila clavipes]